MLTPLYIREGLLRGTEDHFFKLTHSQVESKVSRFAYKEAQAKLWGPLVAHICHQLHWPLESQFRENIRE